MFPWRFFRVRIHRCSWYSIHHVASIVCIEYWYNFDSEFISACTIKYNFKICPIIGPCPKFVPKQYYYSYSYYLILLQLIFLWWLNYSYLRLMLFVGIVLGIGSEAHSSYNSCLHSWSAIFCWLLLLLILLLHTSTTMTYTRLLLLLQVLLSSLFQLPHSSHLCFWASLSGAILGVARTDSSSFRMVSTEFGRLSSALCVLDPMGAFPMLYDPAAILEK